MDRDTEHTSTSRELVSPGKNSLLGLPTHIRQQILRETGLVRLGAVEFIDGHHTPSQTPDLSCLYHPWLSDEPCYCPPFPVGLLGSCKAPYEESLEMFFSENTFRLYNTTSSLSCIRNIPTAAWKQFRNLEFVCDCASAPSFRETKSLWNKLCDIFSVGLRPHKVTITFEIRYCRKVTKLRQLLDSTTVLRPLANARFDAYISPDESRSIAIHEERMKEGRKSLVWHSHVLVHPPSIKSQFPFLKLPKELQSLILANSGLVSRGARSLDGCGNSACCGNCGVREQVGNLGYIHCFCPMGNINLSMMYSATCTCYPPLSSGVFATCREVREEALNIYYSHNQFLARGTIEQVLGVIKSTSIDRLRLVSNLSIRPQDPPAYVTEDLWGLHDTQHAFVSMRNEVEDEWDKTSQLLHSIAAYFQTERLTLDFTYSIDPSVSQSIRGCVKRAFERLCMLIPDSGLKRVSINLNDRTDYSFESSEDLKTVTVYGPGLEGRFDALFESYFSPRSD